MFKFIPKTIFPNLKWYLKFFYSHVKYILKCQAGVGWDGFLNSLKYNSKYNLKIVGQQIKIHFRGHW